MLFDKEKPPVPEVKHRRKLPGQSQYPQLYFQINEAFLPQEGGRRTRFHEGTVRTKYRRQRIRSYITGK